MSRDHHAPPRSIPQGISGGPLSQVPEQGERKRVRSYLKAHRFPPSGTREQGARLLPGHRGTLGGLSYETGRKWNESRYFVPLLLTC